MKNKNKYIFKKLYHYYKKKHKIKNNNFISINYSISF